MSLLELVVLSMALGTDLFSVAVPIGMQRVRRRIIFIAAIVFAAFHIIMILIGYHAGHWLGGFVEHYGTYHSDNPVIISYVAHVAGALVLMALGVQMLWCAVKGEEECLCGPRSLEGLTLLAIAAGVSVDALAVGFSMGMMDVNLWILSLVLGIVIFLIAVAGLGLGRRIGRFLGNKAELTGGLVLFILGAHLLVSLFYE